MTRHLVRLIWNRKRQNLLLTIEIFCSFLVLFAVVLVGLNFTVNASKPLGYETDRVWSVDVGRPAGPNAREDEAICIFIGIFVIDATFGHCSGL